MVAVKNHKPYLKGEKRGEYKRILGNLKQGEWVDVPADDIHRARGTLYMLFPNPLDRITVKINKDVYRIWRAPIGD